MRKIVVPAMLLLVSLVYVSSSGAQVIVPPVPCADGDDNNPCQNKDNCLVYPNSNPPTYVCCANPNEYISCLEGCNDAANPQKCADQCFADNCAGINKFSFRYGTAGGHGGCGCCSNCCGKQPRRCFRLRRRVFRSRCCW